MIRGRLPYQFLFGFWLWRTETCWKQFIFCYLFIILVCLVNKNGFLIYVKTENHIGWVRPNVKYWILFPIRETYLSWTTLPRVRQAISSGTNILNFLLNVPKNKQCCKVTFSSNCVSSHRDNGVKVVILSRLFIADTWFSVLFGTIEYLWSFLHSLTCLQN